MPPPADLDPDSGRARLSYRRAVECFETATAELAGGPWTLHQLRHSALTHAAEDRANTSTLLAYSGHTSVASLARYARVSPAPDRPLRRRRAPGDVTPRLGHGHDEADAAAPDVSAACTMRIASPASMPTLAITAA
ncbi:tyrosine-type recombinase/integrase [Microtetraspora glauca]|uniref:Tyrosine-type recombinase/integrase n=1 Tax=Microtetraspora glauca TaxID=1996 RepID=A0ABV3GKB8_MICGL